MAETRQGRAIEGDEATTRDAEIHGETSGHTNRETIDGTVKTQRGSPDEIAPDVLARGHEPTDIRVRAVAYTIAGLLLFIVLSGALVGAGLAYRQATASVRSVSPLARTALVPPEPRLQMHPVRDRAAIEAAAETRLRAYARDEADPRRARLPIDRAMALLAAHGWPDGEVSSTSPRPDHRDRPDAAAPHAGRDHPSRVPFEQQPASAPPFEAPR